MAISSDISEFIELYKLKKVAIKGDEIHALCPFHDDENIGNFSINLGSGKYFCFACLSGGNILHYGHTLGLGFRKITGMWNRIKHDVEKRFDFPCMPLDSSLVRYYKRFGLSEYALGRINKQTLEEYQVYSDNDGNPIFFILDFQGNYRAVWIRDDKMFPKYFLIEPLNYKNSGYLFGQHIQGDYTVLTEGFFDAMAFRERLGVRGVCMNGVYLSDAQTKTLERLQPLVLFTDGDRRGKMARNKIYQKLKHLDIRICGGYVGDADEMDAEKLDKIIKNAKNKIDWEIYVRNQ